MMYCGMTLGSPRVRSRFFARSAEIMSKYETCLMLRSLNTKKRGDALYKL